MHVTYFIPAIARKMINQSLVLLFELKNVPYTNFKQLSGKTPIRANRRENFKISQSGYYMA